MNNQFYIAKQINADPSKLNENEKLQIVSFKIEVLDKYNNNSDFQIQLNNDVGTLTSKKDGWWLQIDVHNNCGYANIWLYQLGMIPDSEQQYFAQHNIYARELSQTAHRRWRLAQP